MSLIVLSCFAALVFGVVLGLLWQKHNDTCYLRSALHAVQECERIANYWRSQSNEIKSLHEALKGMVSQYDDGCNVLDKTMSEVNEMVAKLEETLDDDWWKHGGKPPF